MSPDSRRRSLLLLACLGPAAQAAACLATRTADGPVDQIRRVFDEVLTSPRQCVTQANLLGPAGREIAN
jgi:hypothetical protein